MPKTFPITIDGSLFRSAPALARDIAYRGDNRVLPDRAAGHPSVYYERWMRADGSGRTQAAVLEACAVLIDEPVSGDALDHAFALTGSDGTRRTTLRIMERVRSGDIPDSRWHGTGSEIALRALTGVTYAVETRLSAERTQLAALLEDHGAFYRAATLLLGGKNPDPAVVDLVARWARSHPIPGPEARILARRVRHHPRLVVPLASALQAANIEARAAFQAAFDQHQPDRSAEVADALAGA
ncbi:MAG: hypothetical protein ACI8S6_002735 [Myxococcota bacterium]|jgi:hypothetical protein